MINHTDDEIDKFMLYAKLDNAKILYNLVKAVNFKEVSHFRFSLSLKIA
jgi:hypothetical protein